LQSTEAYKRIVDMKRKPSVRGLCEGLVGGCEHLRLDVTDARHSATALKLYKAGKDTKGSSVPVTGRGTHALKCLR
jgi:hypothetical protein